MRVRPCAPCASGSSWASATRSPSCSAGSGSGMSPCRKRIPLTSRCRMDPSMLMPGMLTAEQLAQLDRARGPEFDRLFLTFMIQHHQGAITMVNQLFGSQGGGEQETVFRFASDVFADQSTEIDRMNRMLEAFHRSPP